MPALQGIQLCTLMRREPETLVFLNIYGIMYYGNSFQNLNSSASASQAVTNVPVHPQKLYCKTVFAPVQIPH